MRTSIAKDLQIQRRQLIEKNPLLRSRFININLENAKVPFLPIGTFRNFDVFNKNVVQKTFRSSGSTNETRAKHSFSAEALDVYQIKTAESFRTFLNNVGAGENATIISLIPDARTWPESSLAAMIDMFKAQGLKVLYQDFGTIVESQNVVIFGTSFHHLLVNERADFQDLIKATRKRKVTAIHTGGTKGKTRSISSKEVQELIEATYEEAAECMVVSEYGMCELASQAWSLNQPHDGWFRCNETLTPLIIDIDQRAVVEDPDQPGFLAFIDELNRDSFMGIITEDLALAHPSDRGAFKLLGRASDASVKGCSLNVKDDFRSTLREKSQIDLSVDETSQRKSLEDLPSILKELPEGLWDDFSKADLAGALNSIASSEIELEATRDNECVLIVLSANIPITFLYPAIVFMKRGVKELHLRLPSIRPDDLCSERVRNQLSTLIRTIAPYLLPMKINLDEGRDLSIRSLASFDSVLVFGSDNTIRNFRNELGEKVIGLGSVANAHLLSPSDTAQSVSTLCSSWLGRGCLTPIALVGDDPYMSFTPDFLANFSSDFSSRLNDSGVDQKFEHRHVLLEVEARLKDYRLNPREHVLKAESVFVIDLRRLDDEAIYPLASLIEKAGFGLVYILSREQAARLNNLKAYPSNPGILECHMDKTWPNWIR